MTLHATPFQIGLLMAVEFSPTIVFSLPAGAWIDRLRRRPLLIGADLGRAAILLSIPAAYAFGILSLLQLYGVGFLVGSLSVVFDVAQQSYVPTLVDHDQLVAANSRLQISEQGASVLGPALGGSLIGLVTAPLAVAFDAVSYLASAIFVMSIRRPEPALDSEAGAPGPGMIREIGDGIGYVVGHPMLRALVTVAGLIQFFGRMILAVLLVYLVREVRLSAAVVGTILAIGGIGFVAGAVLASPVSARFGLGRTLVGAAMIASLSPLFYALGPRNLAAGFVAAGFFLYGAAAVTWSVNSLSLRQAVTSRAMLGRTAATMRLLSWGAIPFGSVLGGLLGNTIGLHQTILIGSLGGLLGSLPVVLSPVRRLKRLPASSSPVFPRRAR